MAKYVMALDAGTTSNRCILFNEKGEEVAFEQVALIPKLGSNQFGFKGKIDCHTASKSLADFLIACTFFSCLPTHFLL